METERRPDPAAPLRCAAAWRGAIVVLLFLLIVAPTAQAVTFSVQFSKAVRALPATGRLVVFLRARQIAQHDSSPADGLDESDPQPRYGIDVSQLPSDTPAIVDDRATAYPVSLSKLPAGWYRAAAVLIVLREHSQWQSDPGNLYSGDISFEVTPKESPEIRIILDQIVQPRIWPTGIGAELVEVRSKLLSDFRHREVFLHAGVVLPENYDPKRTYPAVYEVPGFGGDHFAVSKVARLRAHVPADSPVHALARNAFWIVLDPESPNGHTLFMYSDNNGPCGDALVTELIPEIERRYKLIKRPDARLLRGHSSGGLSTLWLALTYPQIFGATWSTAPDPVAFERLERDDIYSARNMYSDADGDIPSARFDGAVTLSVRDENAMEDVLGPANTSGGQWDSWQAAFGHRTAGGGIAPLYDKITGEIDHAEAQSYRRFDIADLLRKDPARFTPLFRHRVHLLVGDEDNYYLNEAVELLKAELDRHTTGSTAAEGYIKIIPDVDHSTIYGTVEMQQIPVQMLDFLQHAGHVTKPARATAH